MRSSYSHECRLYEKKEMKKKNNYNSVKELAASFNAFMSK